MRQIKVALDFCLSRRLAGVLSQLYGHLGYSFIHLRDLGIPGKTPDPTWADRYKQFGGQVVLSGDCQIAYKPHEAVAFIDNGFISFFVQEPYSRLKSHEQAAAWVFWWPSIADKIDAVQQGTCWRIPCVARSGDIRLSNREFQPLVIPDQILEAERQKRRA